MEFIHSFVPKIGLNSHPPLDHCIEQIKTGHSALIFDLQMIDMGQT